MYGIDMDLRQEFKIETDTFKCKAWSSSICLVKVNCLKHDTTYMSVTFALDAIHNNSKSTDLLNQKI